MKYSLAKRGLSLNGFSLHSPDQRLRLLIDTIRFRYFLQRFIIGEIVQQIVLQQRHGLLGQFDIANRKRPGNRHFNIISFMLNAIHNLENLVNIFLINIIIQKHNNAKPQLILLYR
ncbi:hypothetical protein D3C81_1574240 [compost metagenome]